MKQKKVVIVDPKVNEDLKKVVKKYVTTLELEPKRRVITRSKETQSPTVKKERKPSKEKFDQSTKEKIT